MEFPAILLLAAFVLAFSVGAPVLSVVVLVRTGRLRREIAELRERIRAIERSAPGAAPARPERSIVPTPAADDASAAIDRSVASAPVQPPRAVPQPAVPPPVRPSTAEESAEIGRSRPLPAARETVEESLETRIGARWLLYIGIAAIVVGSAYFEKLAMDYGWIGETARVVQGALLGVALVVAGLQFVRRGYAAYGQVLSGGGGAILYLSTYAAFSLYALIGRPAAFALMIGITALIAWLADHQRSQGLALFAVGGGFLTPFMFPSTTDAQAALFTYDAILIAGTAALARRRNWPFLHLVSYLLTLVTIAAWADRYYAAPKYLRTELFLTLFCAMFLYIRHASRRGSGGAARFVALFLWSAPAAYYLASLVVLQPHPAPMLVWLVALMFVGGALSPRVDAAGLVLWVAAALPLFPWIAAFGRRGWTREGLITVSAIYGIALLAQVRRGLLRKPGPDPVGLAWLHLNPLGMYAAAYLLVEPISIDKAGYLAAAFAVWQGALAAWLWTRRREQALHLVAVGCTLAAIAVALLFDGPAVTAAWAVEGALVIALGLREDLGWMRAAGVLLFAVAVGQTLARLGTQAPVNQIVFLNPRAACAALVVALCYGLAWLTHRKDRAPGRGAGTTTAVLTAQFVTLALLTSEINGYWVLREGLLARGLALSVTWGTYATALVVVGLSKKYAALRYFAIAVLGVTILKVFFFDLSVLERIYRVASAIGLGVLLLLTSYLYSRSREVTPASSE